MKGKRSNPISCAWSCDNHRMPRVVIVLLYLVGCGGPASAPTTPPAPEQPAPVAAAPAEPAADVERWRAIKASGKAPAGESARDLIPELVELLGHLDPEVRDGIGYEVVAAWTSPGGALDDDGVRALAAALRPRLRAGIDAGESDATYGRSFAALALAAVAARDVGGAVLSAPELTALLGDAVWYAAHENDLRGHTGERGWCHAAAHTADLLKFLARNPRVTGDGPERILGAVSSLTVRRHGYILHHGEDARLAAPVSELVEREAIDAARFAAWAREILGPLLERNQPFDPALYAAQRNARNLLFTLVAQFELRSPRTAPVEAARQALLEVLRGG